MNIIHYVYTVYSTFRRQKRCIVSIHRHIYVYVPILLHALSIYYYCKNYAEALLCYNGEAKVKSAIIIYHHCRTRSR